MCKINRYYAQINNDCAFPLVPASSAGMQKRGCPKSRIAPFAIVYFGKKYYLTVAKTKHYSNG